MCHSLTLFLYSGPVIGLVPRTPQAEEEDRILESYLMGMKIEEGQLTLPPVSERNDLSQMFLDQVVDFIQKNTKGVTIGQQAPSAADPFTGEWCSMK